MSWSYKWKESESSQLDKRNITEETIGNNIICMEFGVLSPHRCWTVAFPNVKVCWTVS